MSKDVHELYDIWEEPGTLHPWKAQLVNYVGNFPTREAAIRYCEGVKRHRAGLEKEVVKVKKNS